MRDDLIILAVLAFAFYNIFFSINLAGLDADCEVENSSGREVKMCMGTDISTTTTKPYLFGTLELPVYRWGVNIEYLHSAFFILDGVLLILGLATDKH